MKIRHQGTQQGYNAQAVVDSKNQIIVEEEVINKPTDNHELTEMIEEAQKNTGKESKETLADRGYYSPEEIVKAETSGRKIIINIPDADKGRKYNKAMFKFDAERNRYICPEGKVLEYCCEKQKTKTRSNVLVYRCKNHMLCESSKECSKSKSGRTVENTKEEALINRYKEQEKKENWKEKLKERGKIIEPVFGCIKWAMGIRRFTVRGLENVKEQWSFICSAYNLKKIYGFWLNGKVKLKIVGA